MRNREPVLKKLDNLESNLSKFNLFLNRGDRESCYNMIKEFKIQIEQIKSYVESEPISGRELNQF